MKNSGKRKLLFLFILILLLLSITEILRAKDLICAGCNQPINGRYWTVNGHIYCDKCYLKYGPKCELCGVALVDDYLVVPYTGNKFCKNCIANYPPCSDCGNPSGPKGYRIDTYRVLCPTCLARAIFTYDQLTLVYQEALAQLRSLGLIISMPVVNLSMMNEDELNKYLRTSGRGESGFCESWSSDNKVYSHRIFVLNGLSYELALSVLCHELTHAWEGENWDPGQASLLIEGFAEWVAYKAMLNKNYTRDANILVNNSDPIYGGGLRYMLNVEASYGTTGTIEYFRKK